MPTTQEDGLILLETSFKRILPTLKPPPPTLMDEIRARHNFGRALVSVIIKEGQRFEKKSPSGQVFRVNYTLPGEIEWPNGQFEKVVFTVSQNPSTGDIIHMYATAKTPSALVYEYAKNGFFPADEENSPSTTPSYHTASAYPLADDGSRVSFVSDEQIDVVQKDKTILRVYPWTIQ